MTRKLPILENEPILRDQGIHSEAQGLEHISQTLGGVSQQLFHTAKTLAADQSSSMYLLSREQMDHEVSQAKAQMYANPGASGAIARATKEKLGMIEQASVVNHKNRGELKAYQSSYGDSLDLEATRNQVETSRMVGRMTFLSSFDNTLKAYQEQLLKDPENETLSDNIHNSIQGLVASRVLTPVEGAHAIKAMHAVTDNVHSFHKIANSATTAREANTAHASLLPQDVVDNAHLPIDENTAHLYHDGNNEVSIQKSYGNAALHKPPSFEDWQALKRPAEKAKYQALWQGSSDAKGLVDSHPPFPEIAKRLNDLKNKGSNLSNTERGEKSYLDNYIKRLQGGDYLSIMAESPGGSSIIRDFVQSESAAQNFKDPETGEMSGYGQAQVTDAYNNMISQSVQLGFAQHIPSQYIQPIPENKVMNVQSSFTAGGDPSLALGELKQLHPENRPYLAYAMKKADQKEVMLANGYMSDDKNQDFQADLINFSKLTPADYSQLHIGKEGMSEANMKMRVEPFIKDIVNFKSRLPQEGIGPSPLDEAEGVRKMTRNYVAGKSIANADIQMHGFNDYMNGFNQNMKKAYDLVKGSDYAFNSKDIPLSKDDAFALAEHMKNMTIKYRGLSKSDLSGYPLYVTASPKGMVYVMSPNNTVLLARPFEPSLLDHALHEHQEANKPKAKGKMNQPLLKTLFEGEE
jgi:hypothetical protein